MILAIALIASFRSFSVEFSCREFVVFSRIDEAIWRN